MSFESLTPSNILSFPGLPPRPCLPPRFATLRLFHRGTLVLSWWVLATLVLGAAAQVRGEQIVLASAELGATGRQGGVAIAPYQHLGWRFEVQQPLVLERVGGHLYSRSEGPGAIYAALVRLDSLEAFPNDPFYSHDELVALSTIQPQSPSSEVFTAMPALLAPGAYALVFGSFSLGASGLAAMPNFLDQPDIFPTTSASYISWFASINGQPPFWHSGGGKTRFVIEAHPYELTADFNVDGVVNYLDYAIWSSSFGSNAMGDATGDGLTDAADYTVWRDSLGQTVSFAPLQPSGGQVPEPTRATLTLLTGLALCVLRSRGA